MDIFSAVISYEELLEACSEMFGFGKVTLLRDFGPLKAGQQVGSLWFWFETGMVKVYSEDDILEQTFQFRLEA